MEAVVPFGGVLVARVDLPEQGVVRSSRADAACGAPALGAIQAIDNAKIPSGQVVVVGFDGLSDEFAAIEKGTEAATIVQFPAKIGELGVKTLAAALKGETVPAFVDTGTDVATKANVATFK